MTQVNGTLQHKVLLSAVILHDKLDYVIQLCHNDVFGGHVTLYKR